MILDKFFLKISKNLLKEVMIEVYVKMRWDKNLELNLKKLGENWI